MVATIDHNPVVYQVILYVLQLLLIIFVKIIKWPPQLCVQVLLALIFSAFYLNLTHHFIQTDLYI